MSGCGRNLKTVLERFPSITKAHLVDGSSEMVAAAHKTAEELQVKYKSCDVYVERVFVQKYKPEKEAY